jgi:hypothetical protein
LPNRRLIKFPWIVAKASQGALAYNPDARERSDGQVAQEIPRLMDGVQLLVGECHGVSFINL